MSWTWFAVLLVGGALIFVLVGYAVGVRKNRTYVGTLRLDHSDPTDTPYLFLELDPGGMEKIQHCKTVALRVRLENYLPDSARK